MKKFYAVILSVIVACSVLTACGNADESSDEKESKASSTSASADEESETDEASSAAEESEAETEDSATGDESESEGEKSKSDEASTADDESEAEESTVTAESKVDGDESKSDSEGGELTEAVIAGFKSGTYEFALSYADESYGELVMSILANGEDYHVSMTMISSGEIIDMYSIDGNGYLAYPSEKWYMVEEDTGDDALDLSSLEFLMDGLTFVETKQEDGYTVEIFTDDTGITQAYYYKDGTLTRVVETDTDGTESETTIKTLKFDDVDKVELPDFTGWTNASAE